MDMLQIKFGRNQLGGLAAIYKNPVRNEQIYARVHARTQKRKIIVPRCSSGTYKKNETMKNKN
jgi:hypothetical protein